MARLVSGALERLRGSAELRRWRRAAEQAETLDLDALHGLRERARRLRVQIERFLDVANDRLALPAIGSNAIQKPLFSDWAWRPELWRRPVSPVGMASVPSKTDFGRGVKIFHDCRLSELTLRQVRNQRESDLAPFGLRMDVFAFDGSFLSLVLEIPKEGVEGLQRRHLVRLATVVEMERPLEIFARLNIRHGPNTEQIVRELPLDKAEVFVDFDLAYTELNEKRVEHMWLDLIFEGAAMNQITLRDVALTRRPRAEL
ncbi:MAG: hypothetical protein D6811_05275 [Alphaproteobacteria bacterium]|nr:MAG: hypothetical protein D6811_05275 [Alphaproteobacteria bacterium]